jgi:hypothetical protein
MSAPSASCSSCPRPATRSGNAWFNNVELIAARRVGQETVVYVRNIYKYYVAYKLQLEMVEARRAAAAKLAPVQVKTP